MSTEQLKAALESETTCMTAPVRTSFALKSSVLLLSDKKTTRPYCVSLCVRWNQVEHSSALLILPCSVLAI
jgi:hypothetical protein